MNVRCAQIDDLLFEGTPLALETAGRHASECTACAPKVLAWNEISATAKGMREEWSSDLLWPRIERELAAEKKRARFSRIAQIAAAAALLVGLGGTMLFALRVQTLRADFDRDILRLGALDEVERAEREHVAAIERLEQLAGSKLESADEPLIVSYKEKLMLLDDAIADCETNIERNRKNAHLRRQLLAMYSEKQKTLQEVLREETHVSNP